MTDQQALLFKAAPGVYKTTNSKDRQLPDSKLHSDNYASTSEIADALQVSPSWVRKQAHHLGGQKDSAGRWRYRTRIAVSKGQSLISDSPYPRQPEYICMDCGERYQPPVNRKTLGVEYIRTRHLQGMGLCDD